MDMCRANLIDMGWELWSTCDIKKRFRLMTSFRHSYFSMNTPTAISYTLASFSGVQTQKSIGKSWKFEAIGQFNFADYTKNRSVKIILEQYTSGYGSYRTTHTKYIMVPGTVRKSFGVRGGFYNLFSPINIGETKAENGRKAFYGNRSTGTSDSLLFGANTNSGSGVISQSGGYTSMNSLVLAAGLDMRTVTNLVVNTDSYGTRSNRLSSNIYIDVLLAVFNNYKTMYVSNYNDSSAFDIKPYGKRPIGWGFGWQFANPQHAWMSMKMEFGKRPEWKSNGFSGAFFDFNFGINIPFHIKKLEN